MLGLRRRTFAAAFLCAGLIPLAALAANNNKLVVHEWGTFTSLEDDRGQQLGGINIDDEPVPSFVHNWRPWWLRSVARREARVCRSDIPMSSCGWRRRSSTSIRRKGRRTRSRSTWTFRCTAAG